MKNLVIKETSNGYIVEQKESEQTTPYVFRSVDDLNMLVHVAKFMCKRNVKIEEK